MGENSQPENSGTKIVRLEEGYKPSEGTKGYKPKTSNLDPEKPPQGGSGVPPKTSANTNSEKKE